MVSLRHKVLFSVRQLVCKPAYYRSLNFENPTKSSEVTASQSDPDFEIMYSGTPPNGHPGITDMHPGITDSFIGPGGKVIHFLLKRPRYKGHPL